ncbi:MAG: hypothetical protein WKF87_17990 [Chryseolinea sp.]
METKINCGVFNLNEVAGDIPACPFLNSKISMRGQFELYFDY